MEVDTLYSIGEWHGIKRFECKLCPFDVLEDESLIQEHLKMHLPPPPAAALVLVAKRDGTEKRN